MEKNNANNKETERIEKMLKDFYSASELVNKATYTLEITENNRVLKLKKNTIEALANTYGIEKEKLKNYYSEKRNKALFRSVLALLDYRQDIFALAE